MDGHLFEMTSFGDGLLLEMGILSKLLLQIQEVAGVLFKINAANAEKDDYKQ